MLQVSKHIASFSFQAQLIHKVILKYAVHISHPPIEECLRAQVQERVYTGVTEKIVWIQAIEKHFRF